MKTGSSELLEEVTRRLVAEFQPEQIILFGSHAWGTPHEDSDVDLLVIVSHSDEEGYLVMRLSLSSSQFRQVE